MSVTVTVYTTGDCMGCVQTKRHLDRRQIGFTEIPIDDDTREAIMSLGYTSAPVVCANIAGKEQTWAGYRPDRLDALARAAKGGAA